MRTGSITTGGSSGTTATRRLGTREFTCWTWRCKGSRSCGSERSLPNRITGHGGIYWLDDAKEVPDTQMVAYDYRDLLLTFELRSFANDQVLHVGHPSRGTDFYTAFYGTEGTLMVTESGWNVSFANGERGPAEKGVPELHEKNFLECLKSRERPNSDVEIGRLSTTMCHLANISYHLGRDVHFDPKTETFPGDKEASKLLAKEYRAGYAPPNI